MKRSAVFVIGLAAGCGFQAGASGGSTPIDAGLLPPPDGGVAATVTFDSAADFAAAGYTGHDVTIEREGALTPDGYLQGGLLGYGVKTNLWSHGSVLWSQIDGKTPTGAGQWRGNPLAGADVSYFGVASNADLSIWFVGDVYLTAGSNELFQVIGDDVAFFQIAQPGSTSFTPSSDNANPVAVSTPVTGWYPIRIGYSNNNGGNSLTFTHADDGGAQVAWTPDRLRARLDDQRGALRTVFANQLLAGGTAGVPPIATIESGPLLAFTTFTTVPQGTAGNDNWSARYVAQLHVTKPGSYSLTASSDDGNRVRLAGMRANSHWGRDDGSNMALSSSTVDLAAGWNDLQVDYNQVNLGRALHVQMSGPDFTLTTEVPHDQLRPVESFDDRLVFGADDTSHTIPDNGGAGGAGVAAMTVAAAALETVTSIDVTFVVNAKVGDQIAADLETPDHHRVTIRPATPGTPSGVQTLQVSIPAGSAGDLGTLLGGAAGGAWQLEVYDTSNAGTGGASTLMSARLTLHTTGRDAIARTAQWTSPPMDQGSDVIAIDDVAWDEIAPTGSSHVLSVRACTQADCSDNPAFIAAPRLKAFGVPPGRYLQVRVDITSNGAASPELQRIAIQLRKNG